MTPEERAAEIADAGLADNSDYIDWDAEGPNLTPMKLENLIASAIRAAVVEEQERILTKLNALAEQQLGYANDPKNKDNRVVHHHAANMLGILRGDILGYKSP
jgi:hypothetical protein